MKNISSDSAIINALRVFVGIRLLYSFLPLISQLVALRLRLVRIEPGHPLISLLETSVILVYLSIPWLRSKLGRVYLPLALIAVTLGPVLEYYLTANRRVADTLTQAQMISGQWQLMILLFVPLILVSWRYSYLIVIAFTASLWLMDTLLLIPWLKFLGVVVLTLWILIWFRSGIFLLIGYVVNRLVSEQRQEAARLEEANRQLANHAMTVEQLAVSRERNYLARELHDTLAHTLSGVAVQLEAVNSLWDTNAEKARMMLQDSLALTRNGLNEARRSIQSLRASPLDDLGLAGALRNLAQTTAERGGLVLNLQIQDNLPALNPSQEHALYRIAEEAMRNAEIHARANRLGVYLGQTDRKLIMSIQDDGRGFDAKTAGKENHFGLSVMRERAESIGAVLLVESRPGGGTMIRLVMEIKDDTGINLR